jgi:putative selenium metabolism hydrolase
MNTNVLQNEVIELAQSLFRIPSTTGNEAEIASFIKNYLDECGFDTVIDRYNSVIGILRKGNGPVVVLDAHIDTVLVNPEEWEHHPYKAEIADGKIFARGASDMKGAMAAMMQAGKTLSQDENFKGTLVITGSAWEEHFEGYTLEKEFEYLSSKGIKPDYVIIGEASELNIKRGQRGRTRIHFDVKGKPAHSASPEKGVNAVYKAMDLVKAIRELEPREDPFLGKSIIELIGIDSQPKPIDSVVPYNCRVSYDLRLIQGDTREKILGIFENVVNDLKKNDKDFQVEISIASGELTTTDGKTEIVEAFPPAWAIDESHPIVQKTKEALESIGQKPEITKYNFCTNGSYSAGEAEIPTIGYGPGYETTAHIIDEYIEIDHLVKVSEGYAAIVRSLTEN